MKRLLVQLILDMLTESYRLFRTLITCNHARAPFTEGKSICPDCGRGVILQWAVLRCAHCHQKRASHFVFRSVIPTENYCMACGERETHLEYLDEPDYYKLHKAILLVQDEDEYLHHRHRSWQQSTRVWFEENLNPSCRGLLASAG